MIAGFPRARQKNGGFNPLFGFERSVGIDLTPPVGSKVGDFIVYYEFDLGSPTLPAGWTYQVNELDGASSFIIATKELESGDLLSPIPRFMSPVLSYRGVLTFKPSLPYITADASADYSYSTTSSSCVIAASSASAGFTIAMGVSVFGGAGGALSGSNLFFENDGASEQFIAIGPITPSGPSRTATMGVQSGDGSVGVGGFNFEY